MKILLSALLMISSFSHAENATENSSVVKPEVKRKKKKELPKDPKALPPHLTKGPVHERPMPL